MSRTASFLMTAEAPVEATKPYFPILWVNLLVAVILGLIFSTLVIITSEQIARYREAAPW
jgi:membrane protein CcdC involved in cytochrome C biogenesis